MPVHLFLNSPFLCPPSSYISTSPFYPIHSTCHHNRKDKRWCVASLGTRIPSMEGLCQVVYISLSKEGFNYLGTLTLNDANLYLLWCCIERTKKVHLSHLSIPLIIHHPPRPFTLHNGDPTLWYIHTS